MYFFCFTFVNYNFLMSFWKCLSSLCATSQRCLVHEETAIPMYTLGFAFIYACAEGVLQKYITLRTAIVTRPPHIIREFLLE